MTKIQSPCATCEHHLFGLPKTCEKCEKECEPRKRYVELIERGDLMTYFDYDPADDQRLPNFNTFECD